MDGLNLIVTIPKRENRNIGAEEADIARAGGKGTYFWPLGNFPKIRPGARIFFVENGLLKGYHVLKQMKMDVDGVEERCATTNRVWRGKVMLYMNADWWPLPGGPKPMKGFQGFRYADDDGNAIKRVGGGWEPLAATVH